MLDPNAEVPSHLINVTNTALTICAETLKEEAYNYCADLFRERNVPYTPENRTKLQTNISNELCARSEALIEDILDTLTKAYSQAKVGNKEAASNIIERMRDRMVNVGRSVGEIVGLTMLEELQGLPPAPQLQ